MKIWKPNNHHLGYSPRELDGGQDVENIAKNLRFVGCMSSGKSIHSEVKLYGAYSQKELGALKEFRRLAKEAWKLHSRI